MAHLYQKKNLIKNLELYEFLIAYSVITLDNEMITAHRIGWIIWIYQIIKRIGYHISKAKSVRI